ncbi:hypothetical protein EV424DRAFT_1352496 [Suillus variegatus]|nr:hypothetical protein EV424DRAFT_1352496 [Suillus variegatus]
MTWQQWHSHKNTWQLRRKENCLAAAATANQALIALLGRLNQMVEEVLWSWSEDERMRLSRVIASQMNDAIHSYQMAATYIPLRLLSMAAEIHRAQRVPDWTRVGNNEDICRGHPLYPKTLGPPPTHTTPTSAPTLPSGPPPAPAPVPAPASPPAPAPVPAPAPPLAPAPLASAPPAPALPAPSTIRIPANTTSGAIAGPSKPRKQQFSASPPHQVKRARKAIPKSKPLLTDTDTDGDTVRIGKDKPKVKGKGKGKAKAKARATSPDRDIWQMTMEDGNHDPAVILRNPKQTMVKQKLPTIVITTRPMPPPPDQKKKAADSEKYEPEEEEEEEEEDDDEDAIEPETWVKPGEG